MQAAAPIGSDAAAAIPQEPGPQAAPFSRIALAATVAGNALEFYDFITYSFFAVYIGHAFFPRGNDLANLLLSLATFGIGFFTRPLGGVLIGAYADHAGRRPALMLTIVLMTIGTLAVAVTPTYAQIGIAAPIILVLGRLIQGLALGGEVGPSTGVAPMSPGRAAARGSRCSPRARLASPSPRCSRRSSLPTGAGACRSCWAC
jgi:MFS family permease